MRFVLPPVLALVSACQVAGRGPDVHAEPVGPSWGDEIVVCGRRFHTGAPVVLWTRPPSYTAYSPHTHFLPETDPKAAKGLRYQPGRKPKDGPVLVAPGTDDLDEARAVIDQFVLHYDVAGTSENCFKVLQDLRGLSVHFMLDVDGTIYQTLDLRDQGFHATKANPRSVGIEIANMGAYTSGEAQALDDWYRTDAAGPYLLLPDRLKDGVRTQGFVGRPARAERIRGRIQGLDLEQYDFTPEQYDSLAKLAATLCRVLPRIAPDAPRGPDGAIRDVVLSDEEYEAFHGILGHYHVQANKQDPGPAFDWERFLAAVRERLAGSGYGT